MGTFRKHTAVDNFIGRASPRPARQASPGKQALHSLSEERIVNKMRMPGLWDEDAHHYGAACFGRNCCVTDGVLVHGRYAVPDLHAARTAYDFLGGPRTPTEFVAAFAKEGSYFDVLWNDTEGIVLEQRETKVPIPIFRKKADCDSALNQALHNLGEKYGSPFVPWMRYSR